MSALTLGTKTTANVSRGGPGGSAAKACTCASGEAASALLGLCADELH